MQTTLIPSYALQRVWIYSVLFAIYSVMSQYKSQWPFSEVPDVPLALDAALTFAMAVLMSFRINRAYERWWEARTLWGTLVNVSRNIAVKCSTMIELSADQRQELRDLLVGYAYGLKGHLREGADPIELSGLSFGEQARHFPSRVVTEIYRTINQWKSQGLVNDQQAWIIDTDARVLLDVCGACERIKGTLMSVSWRTFTQQCILIYLLVFPWGMVDDFRWWVVPMTAIVSYFIISSESIAYQVERPFGATVDHLDLEGICEAIDHSVSEILVCQPKKGS